MFLTAAEWLHAAFKEDAGFGLARATKALETVRGSPWYFDDDDVTDIKRYFSRYVRSDDYIDFLQFTFKPPLVLADVPSSSMLVYFEVDSDPDESEVVFEFSKDFDKSKFLRDFRSSFNILDEATLSNKENYFLDC